MILLYCSLVPRLSPRAKRRKAGRGLGTRLHMYNTARNNYAAFMKLLNEPRLLIHVHTKFLGTLLKTVCKHWDTIMVHQCTIYNQLVVSLFCFFNMQWLYVEHDHDLLTVNYQLVEWLAVYSVTGSVHSPPQLDTSYHVNIAVFHTINSCTEENTWGNLHQRNETKGKPQLGTWLLSTHG